MEGHTSCANQEQIKLQKNILKEGFKLVNNFQDGISIILFVNNKPLVVGTKHILKLFNEKISKEELENARKEDIIEMQSDNPNEPLLQVESPSSEAAKRITDMFTTDKPQILPVRLAALSRPNKLNWLSEEIKRDQQVTLRKKI